IAAPGRTVATGITYAKRLVGLPGEWIAARGGRLRVCLSRRAGCRILHEPPTTGRLTDFAPVHVPAGRYFFLGDNFAQSSASRQWGSIRRTQILARVRLPESP